MPKSASRVQAGKKNYKKNPSLQAWGAAVKECRAKGVIGMGKLPKKGTPGYAKIRAVYEKKLKEMK